MNIDEINTRLAAIKVEMEADGADLDALTAEVDPKMVHPPLYWSISDPESANLSVGDDRLSCSFTALKPSGKNELTVKCYGMEYTIPVYLWKR